MIKVLKVALLCVSLFILGFIIREHVNMRFGSKFIFENDMFEFKNIKEGKPALHYKKFKNDGMMPLKVRDVQSDCGCTVVDWNKNEVSPGQYDSILVEYDTKYSGLINRVVTIETNSYNSPHVFYLTGNIVPNDL